MLYTTKQYRDEMQLPFRGKSHIYVYIGLINKDAQRSAGITSAFSGDESQLYDNASPSYTGVTSTENDGHMTFTFEDLYELNIAGLTLEFNTTPAVITVTNGDKTASYSVTGSKFSFDDGYTNCHYITITPNSGKLSIKNITFGIGLQFTDRQLISTNRQNVVSHISNELPRKSFTFEVDNRPHLFNKDNPFGYSDYLQEKQEVTYDYSRELSDGSEYKIKGGRVFLKDWSSDDYTAKFSCVGGLDYLDGEYYKGQYYEDGRPAYDIARHVFEDAGVSNYLIDESLKRVAVYNPLPICKHREALQYIANASRAVLFEDRDGNICLVNANRPSFILECEFHGATSYSIPSTLFDNNAQYNYADAEYNYAKADGSLYFLPENESFMQVGFVSNELANGSGHFTSNPSIHVTFKSEYMLNQLIFNFALVTPAEMQVIFYKNGEIVQSTNVTNIEVTTSVDFGDIIDEFYVEFISATPNQRIHLNNIYLDGYIDYEITYHDLKDTPVATSLEKVSKVNVHTFQYFEQGEEPPDAQKQWIHVEDIENEDGGITKAISTTQVIESPVATIQAVEGDNLATFNQPCYDLAVDYGTIKESGAYYVIVESDEVHEITVTGKYYTVTDNVYSIDVHEKGVEKNSANPLIGTNMMAQQQAKWLKDYYDDDLEYSLTYRGDPTVDADDLFYLENNFVAKNEIRVSDESIQTSIGMDFTCKLVARRTSFQVSASIDSAIVGRIKVGEVI